MHKLMSAGDLNCDRFDELRAAQAAANTHAEGQTEDRDEPRPEPEMRGLKRTALTIITGSSSRALRMVILGTVLFGLAAAACGSTVPSASAARPKVTVAIKDFIYTPMNLETPVGTTVTWTNQDTAQHTSTHAASGSIQLNPDGGFNLAGSVFNVIENENGGSGSYTFTEPGTYEYFCLWHNAMRGTVVVK